MNYYKFETFCAYSVSVGNGIRFPRLIHFLYVKVNKKCELLSLCRASKILTSWLNTF